MCILALALALTTALLPAEPITTLIRILKLVGSRLSHLENEWENR